MDKRLLIYLLLFLAHLLNAQEKKGDFSVEEAGTSAVDTIQKKPEVDFHKAAIKLQDSAKWKESMIPLKKALKINPEI